MKSFFAILAVAALVAVVTSQGLGGFGGGLGGFGGGSGGSGGGSGGGSSGGGSSGGSGHHHEKEIIYHDHPKYHFEYKIEDHKHKDYHQQHEVRDGHVVKGVYSLLEPDHKTIRIVEYEADKKGGFRANVKHAIHH